VNYINGPGIDNKLKQTTGSTTSYFLTDHLGSTVGLVDQSGSITSQTAYDSFGNATSQLPTRYGYTGREADEYTGLYYYRARFYDPQIGRFISEDPIGFSGGINWYAYVNNNPIRFNDPFGLLTTEQQCMLRWAGVGAVVGTVLGGVGGAAVGALGFAGGPLGLVTTPAVSVKGAILGAVGGAAVGGFVGGFVCGGGSIPVPCDNPPRAVPIPASTPTTIPLVPPMPRLAARKWKCLVRCNIQKKANAHPDCPDTIEGIGYGNTPSEAKYQGELAAKANFTALANGRQLNCHTKHCHEIWCVQE
jgi:RHS repeat-associated protein